jgi:hypothetical protein
MARRVVWPGPALRSGRYPPARLAFSHLSLDLKACWESGPHRSCAGRRFLLPLWDCHRWRWACHPAGRASGPSRGGRAGSDGAFRRQPLQVGWRDVRGGAAAKRRSRATPMGSVHWAMDPKRQPFPCRPPRWAAMRLEARAKCGEPSAAAPVVGSVDVGFDRSIRAYSIPGRDGQNTGARFTPLTPAVSAAGWGFAWPGAARPGGRGLLPDAGTDREGAALPPRPQRAGGTAPSWPVGS